jgi:uncharacterized iron-regulated protein
MTKRMIVPALVSTLFGLSSAVAVSAQEPETAAPDTAYHPGAYQVFTGAGKPATMDDIVRAMGGNQVIFVGETHDDPTAHMLELELLKGATAKYGVPSQADSAAKPGAGDVVPGSGGGRPVALSLEFFETDVQLPLDEYLAGLISESSFLADTRPWPRYRTDYRPLIEFAKDHDLPVIAANAPRRYVNMVARHGRESLNQLSRQALAYLPPLPYGHASAAYRDQWIATIAEVMKQEGMKCGVPVAHAAAPPGSHAQMGNQLDSQVLWDATMAYSIFRYLSGQPDALVLHMVGGFHVERDTGIPEQLRAYMPDLRSMIVSLRPVADVSTFEPAPSGQWGDFVIQTDSTRTMESIECRHFRAERGLK